MSPCEFIEGCYDTRKLLLERTKGNFNESLEEHHENLCKAWGHDNCSLHRKYKFEDKENN